MPLELPTELLAQVLALAASHYTYQRQRPHHGQALQPQAAGRLMLTCKQFLEATRCAAFWQDTWVIVPTMTLHHPSHAPLNSKLSVSNDEGSEDTSEHIQPLPGRAACLIYQPWLPRLKALSVSLGSMPSLGPAVEVRQHVKEHHLVWICSHYPAQGERLRSR